MCVDTQSTLPINPAPGRGSAGKTIKNAGFYCMFGKRAIDVMCSAVGLLLLSPMFILLALVVKATSRGPAFYTQGRVGRHGKIFEIVKFRSMHIGADRAGPVLTCSGDRRLTPIGRFLRRFKLDELPQLWNVLVGEMSLVGPRPEHPRYVEMYTSEQRRVFVVRPGITDTASICYRNEEELLGRVPDPERFYRQVILPHKLHLNIHYIDHISAAYDCRLVFQTIKSVMSSSSTAASINR